jgi:PilZ domain
MSYEHAYNQVGVNPTYPAERRSSLRLAVPFRALTRWRSRGASVEEEVTLANLSAHGLRTQISQLLAVGEPLFVLVRFDLRTEPRIAGPGVAIRGVIIRTEQLADGRCDIALLFTHHRMLFESYFTPPHGATLGRTL